WVGKNCRPNAPGTLFGRDPEAAVAPGDLGEALGEALAVGIDQRGGARARDRVGTLAERDVAGEDRPDHLRHDRPVVGAAALPGVAVALDQARAFRRLHRDVGGEARGFDDEREPLLDRGLLLGVTMAARPPALELRQQPEAQIT